MIANFLLLDLAPGPPSPGIGIGELILVGLVVLMFTGAAIAGFVFLIRRLRKTGAGTRVVVGDACLNVDSLASRSNQPIRAVAQAENSPNQP